MKAYNTFIFDTNKCVGCHACVVACVIENQTQLPMVWREVHTYNAYSLPDLPVFYHSLACNHCNNAPCKDSCPALAFVKDDLTNAVTHNAERCIGCKYCTWACPYDAPKFNTGTKIIEKCTFCNSRLLENLKPSCVNHCPTGALEFSKVEYEEEKSSTTGFPDENAQPNIQFVQSRESKTPEIAVPQTGEDIIEKLILEQSKPNPKISLREEWPLVVFTMIAAFIVAIYPAMLWSNVDFNPWIFMGLGITGILLSSVHLGKKLRVFRSILNLRRSWLSREVFFYSGFILLSVLSFWLYPSSDVIHYLTIGFGLLAIISVDRVYHVTTNPSPFQIHSASLVLTCLAFAALFMNYMYILIAVMAVKTILYVGRKISFTNRNIYLLPGITFFRLIFSIGIPAVFFFLDFVSFFYLSATIIVGEIIDRCEYYLEMDAITPKKQMQEETEAVLNARIE